MPSRWLCVPLMNGSGQAMSPQPVGTLCFPLYPTTSQPSSATISTVCVPVYEGSAPGKPISNGAATPQLTSTAGTTGGSPTPSPAAMPTATPPSVTPASPTPVVTPLLTPSPTTSPTL